MDAHWAYGLKEVVGNHGFFFLKVQIQGQVPQKGGENMLKGLLILAGMRKLYRLVRKYR